MRKHAMNPLAAGRAVLRFSVCAILIGLVAQAPAENAARADGRRLAEAAAALLPQQGFQSRIRLGGSVVALVEHGVIDRQKFAAVYKDRGGLPAALQDVLSAPSEKPIVLTRQNARNYVNLLWPLGLANTMAANGKSPIAGKSLFTYASTGGWNLGREKNGGTYFNKFKILALTPQQEALVVKIARSTYRPCCNNSTFFQDCNHGSALLGLLELGASQGLTEDELYREALAFNAFWFPSNYVQTALYFEVVKNVPWRAVDPRTIMGFDYSALGPWSKNVQAEVAKIPNLLPRNRDAACGI